MARDPVNLSQARRNTNIHDAFGAQSGGRTFPHSGRDWHPIKAGAAVPIYAIEGGTVIRVAGSASATSGPGLHVIIRSAPNRFYLYGHLSSRNVNVGAVVGEGRHIGNMGNSGGSFGVHLHVTLFTTQAAAMANAVPTRLNGRTVAQWASANNLADPLAVIDSGNSGGGSTPSDPLGGIMSYYTSKSAFRNDIRDIIRRHVPRAEMNSAYTNPQTGATFRSNVASEIRRATNVGYQNRIKNDRAEAKIDALTETVNQLMGLVRKIGTTQGIPASELTIDTHRVLAASLSSLEKSKAEAAEEDEALQAELVEMSKADEERVAAEEAEADDTVEAPPSDVQ